MDMEFAIMIIKYIEIYKKHAISEIDFPIDEIIEGLTKYMEYQEVFFDTHEEREKFYEEEVEGSFPNYV